MRRSGRSGEGGESSADVVAVIQGLLDEHTAMVTGLLESQNQSIAELGQRTKDLSKDVRVLLDTYESLAARVAALE